MALPFGGQLTAQAGDALAQIILEALYLAAPNHALEEPNNALEEEAAVAVEGAAAVAVDAADDRFIAHLRRLLVGVDLGNDNFVLGMMVDGVGAVEDLIDLIMGVDGLGDGNLAMTFLGYDLLDFIAGFGIDNNGNAAIVEESDEYDVLWERIMALDIGDDGGDAVNAAQDAIGVAAVDDDDDGQIYDDLFQAVMNAVDDGGMNIPI
jgi:hypothetical protein